MRNVGTPPPPPKKEKTESSINEDEMEYILSTTLLDVHLEDPVVMRFIMSYLNCRERKQAAEEAGITRRCANVLLQRRDIARCIRSVTAKAAMKYDYDSAEVIGRVKEFLEVDPSELQDKETGEGVTNLHDIRPELRRSIKKFKIKNLYDTDPNGMKIKVGELVECEFYDKLKAAELLGAEQGVFKKTTVQEHTVSDDMKQALLESREKAQERTLAYRKSKEIDVTPVKGDNDGSGESGGSSAT